METLSYKLDFKIEFSMISAVSSSLYYSFVGYKIEVLLWLYILESKLNNNNANASSLLYHHNYSAMV